MSWLVHHISGHPISYLVLMLAAGGDVLFPLIPSETVVITAGIVAAKGGLLIPLVVVATIAGALLGDLASFALGRRVGVPLARRLFGRREGRRRLAAAEHAVRSHGLMVIVVGRFIPGGRTATTFACGTLCVPLRRFVAADALGATLWALYVSLLGYLGGSAFEHDTWKAVALSLGIAALVTVGIEAWRRFQRRRGRSILGDPPPRDVRRPRAGRARRAEGRS